MYSALSICVLFILLMQLVNGAQFLNSIFLPVLSAAAPAPAVLLTVIFALTSIYMHHCNHINYILALLF